MKELQAIISFLAISIKYLKILTGKTKLVLSIFLDLHENLGNVKEKPTSVKRRACLHASTRQNFAG